MSAIQLVDSDVCQVKRLLEICQQETVTCSMEFQIASSSENSITLINEVPRIDYIETDQGDFLEIGFGNAYLSFPVTDRFSKFVTEVQIFMCVSNDYYTAWITSARLSKESIRKAKSIGPCESGEHTESR